MNLRIQTYGGYIPEFSLGVLLMSVADNVSVYEVLRKALDGLTDLCDVVEDKFTVARDEFDAANPDREKPKPGGVVS